jgi:GntR family transcriptional regulator
VLLQVDKRGGSPIYRQVFEQIRQQIAGGQLAPGAQLTSVRDLASELKVNPMTISKAYARLELEGWAERRAGVGLFVAGTGQRPEAGPELLEPSMRAAALAARQLGVKERDAVALFERLYRELSDEDS